MLIYDESEIYSCPEDFLREVAPFNRLADDPEIRNEAFNLYEQDK